MWNIQRMSFYVENLHLYNNFFVRVYTCNAAQRNSKDCKCISGARERVPNESFMMNLQPLKIRMSRYPTSH